jgi:predicted ribosome quality control (RQC) complex YloA/Tae2 family protein
MNSNETDEERLPFRHYAVDGWDVYIGKNDEQNDELSARFARPSDIWMHVASQAGSHVVVRRDDKAFPAPQEVLEKAAALAAWFSKARNARNVKVHATEARNVHKPKNAPPGQVHIGKFKTLRVKPVSPREMFPEGSAT